MHGMEGFGALLYMAAAGISALMALSLAISFVIHLVIVLPRRRHKQAQEKEVKHLPAEKIVLPLLLDIHIPGILFCTLVATHSYYIAVQHFFYPTFAYFHVGQPIFWITYGLLGVTMGLRVLRRTRPERMVRIAADFMVVVLFLIWATMAVSINSKGSWISNATAEQALEWSHMPGVSYSMDSKYLSAVDSWAKKHLDD